MVFAGISEGFLAVLPWIRLRGSESIYLVQRRFYATQTPMQIAWGFGYFAITGCFIFWNGYKPQA
jgi:hypothetical protein